MEYYVIAFYITHFCDNCGNATRVIGPIALRSEAEDLRERMEVNPDYTEVFVTRKDG